MKITGFNIPKWKSRKFWGLLFPTALLIIALCVSFAPATPTMAATTVVAEYPGCNGPYWPRITSGRYAQTFTTGPSDTHANTVQLMLDVYRCPTTIQVSITGTTSGLPDDSKVLCSGTGICNWYNELGWFQISLGSGASLTANTKYALVVKADADSSTGIHFIDWNGDSANGYTDGNTCVYSGSQWKTASSSSDCYFKVLDITADTYPLTVSTNPASINSTTGSGTYAAGATVPISAPENVDITSWQSRYHFNGWTGAGVTFADASSPNTTMTMPSSATTVTATYVIQYKVTFDASANVKGDSTEKIVTVAGSYKTASALPFTTDWITSGDTLIYSYTKLVDGTSGAKYAWASTDGLDQSLENNSFFVNAGGTITGNYTGYNVAVSPEVQRYSDEVTFTASIYPVPATPPTDVHFYVGTQDMGSANLTNAGGILKGSLNTTLLDNGSGQLAAGAKTVTAKWDNQDASINPTTSLTIMKDDTALTITSSDTLANGSVTVKAALLADGTSPIAGRTVNFTAGGVSATGITDATGSASATLSLPPGQYTVSASFGGDAYYLPSSTPAQTLYVYQPTQFVIWGGNLPNLAGAVKVGQDFTFWGDQWAKQVTAGDFPANSSFKGYADKVTGPAWICNPGNSSEPPATIGSYIGVIVTTHASKKGNVISGNIADTVVLRVDNPAAYQPDAGHSVTGIVVAVVH